MMKVDIQALIPQREPIIMVDRLDKVEHAYAETSLEIRPDNFFVAPDGRLEEAGIIEHIAQSALAFAGYWALQAGASKPPVGYIGEVKKFHCYRCPQTGEILHTRITIEAEAEGITLVRGETSGNGTPVADTQMKISI